MCITKFWCFKIQKLPFTQIVKRAKYCIWVLWDAFLIFWKIEILFSKYSIMFYCKLFSKELILEAISCFISTCEYISNRAITNTCTSESKTHPKKGRQAWNRNEMDSQLILDAPNCFQDVSSFCLIYFTCLNPF